MQTRRYRPGRSNALESYQPSPSRTAQGSSAKAACKLPMAAEVLYFTLQRNL